MSKPLSNFDYLINKTDKTDKSDNPPSRQGQQVPMPQNFPNRETVDPLSEALAALAMPILMQLNTAPDGKQTMFRLVETLKISVDDLRPVLDLMVSRHDWVHVDKSDLKGDWLVSLTARGREYLRRYAR